MPRYFFHTDGALPFRDDPGIDLADAATARSQAVALAGDLMRDLGAGFWDRPAWGLTVLDERGRVVCALRVEGTRAGD